MTTTRYVLASYADEHGLLGAVRAARGAGLRIVDVYTPYAVHGLDRAMGLRPSRLTWVCFGCGALGAGLMLWFQFWTSAQDWPINVGGKPFDSLPAFIPITFELTVLLGGLGVVAALFLRCGLWPGKRARMPMPRVTDDRLVLVVALEGAGQSAEDARALLQRHDPVEIEEHVGEGDA